MNKITTLLLGCLMAIGMSAQGNLSANQRLLGHTVTDDIDVSGAVVGTPGTYTIGAVLGTDVLSGYEGCRVVGIRVAAAVDLGRTRLFLSGVDANEAVTPIHSQTQRIYEGWNEVFFNGDGFEITGDEGLFYGFDYKETQEMLDNEKGGIASTGADTTGSFYLFQNGTLYPVSGVGMLCVQLIVDVTNLPADNAAISFFDTGFKYKKTTEDVEVFAIVTNTGRDELASYRMGWRYDDLAPEYADVTLGDGEELATGGQTSWQQVCALPEGMAAGTHTISVWVESVNGTAVTQTDVTRRTVSYAAYDSSMTRRGSLLEVYADQTSVYTSLLDPALKEPGENTFVVSVHAPGTPLAVKEAEPLFDRYAYALPSFTSNRSYFPGEAHIAYDMNQYLGTFDNSMIIAILQDIVAQDNAMPTFAGIELTTDFNPATRLLAVTASGDALPDAEAIFGKVAVTLMAVEDGVVGDQMVLSRLGKNPVNKHDYEHNHVLRGYITPMHGAPLTITDGKYSATFTMTVPADWNADRLSVTGILTKAADSADAITAANARDYDVINAASVPLKSGAGVDTVAADTSSEIEGYYTLQGVRADASQLTPGIYVRRYTDGRADKVVIK